MLRWRSNRLFFFFSLFVLISTSGRRGFPFLFGNVDSLLVCTIPLPNEYEDG
jgi:hypothetical protein